MSAALRASLRVRLGRLLLVLILLAAAGAVAWYRGLRSGEPEEAAPPQPLAGDSQAQMVTRDFRHVEMEMDRTVWVLEAKVAEIFEERAKLQQVKITYYGGREEPQGVVTSRTGRVDFETRNAVLTGQVRVVRADGATLRTAELRWDNEQRTLTAPRSVVIQSPQLDIRGQSLVANLAEKWVKVAGAVRGKIRPRVPLLPSFS